jgi:hypothetical protein
MHEVCYTTLVGIADNTAGHGSVKQEGGKLRSPPVFVIITIVCVVSAAAVVVGVHGHLDPTRMESELSSHTLTAVRHRTVV